MTDRTLVVQGVRVPRFLYGTAWEEDQTQFLTELALRLGFRGIDTANQRRHYHEVAVGQAIAVAVTTGQIMRDELVRDEVYLSTGSRSPPALRRSGPNRYASREVAG